MNILALMLSLLVAQTAASVEGVVVKMGSSEPLAGIRVELHLERAEDRSAGRSDVRPETYTVSTSEAGKFTFQNVAAGAYRLIATRDGGGYVPAEYGQRSPSTQGIPFD